MCVCLFVCVRVCVRVHFKVHTCTCYMVSLFAFSVLDEAKCKAAKRSKKFFKRDSSEIAMVGVATCYNSYRPLYILLQHMLMDYIYVLGVFKCIACWSAVLGKDDYLLIPYFLLAKTFPSIRMPAY